MHYVVYLEEVSLCDVESNIAEVSLCNIDPVKVSLCALVSGIEEDSCWNIAPDFEANLVQQYQSVHTSSTISS